MRKDIIAEKQYLTREFQELIGNNGLKRFAVILNFLANA